jgi:hypothetical protein
MALSPQEWTHSLRESGVDAHPAFRGPQGFGRAGPQRGLLAWHGAPHAKAAARQLSAQIGERVACFAGGMRIAMHGPRNRMMVQARSSTRR